MGAGREIESGQAGSGEKGGVVMGGEGKGRGREGAPRNRERGAGAGKGSLNSCKRIACINAGLPHTRAGAALFTLVCRSVPTPRRPAT